MAEIPAGLGQVQLADYAGAWQRGQQIGQENTLNQLKIAQARSNLSQSQALQQLKIQGLKDPKAAAIVAQLDPEYGKQLQEYQAKKTVFYGSKAGAAAKLPISMRNDAYTAIYNQMKDAGDNVGMFPLPDGPWSDAKQAALEYGSNAAIEPAKYLEYQQKNRQAGLDAAGGVQGALVNRYLKEGPDFRNALLAVQGGTKQGIGLDNNGNIKPIPGYIDNKGKLEFERSKQKILGEKDPQETKGQNQLSSLIGEMANSYEKLGKSGGAIDTDKSALSNIGAATRSSGVGQFVGRISGTKEQSIRNQIKAKKPALINAIRQATNMSAKAMDSNAELQFYLKQVTDENVDIQTNLEALKTLERLYGKSSRAFSGEKSQLLPASNSSNESGRLKFNPETGQIE